MTMAAARQGGRGQGGRRQAAGSYCDCTQEAERAQKAEPSSKDPQALSPVE